MIVIPAMDIIDGKVVRLKKGEYTTKREYSDNPLEIAKVFEGAGLNHLHIVDLDGAKGGCPENLGIVEEIASKTSLHIDFGGGIKSVKSLESAISAGAKEVSLGSLAVKNPEIVMDLLKTYCDNIILSADESKGLIAITGWTEETKLEVIPFIKNWYDEGIKKVISTNIEKDGMLSGPDFDLYRKIGNEIPGLKVVASGGIRNKEDLIALNENGLWGAIVGKAYYEGRIKPSDMKEAEDAS